MKEDVKKIRLGFLHHLILIKQPSPFIQHLLCAPHFTRTLASPHHNPTKQLCNPLQGAGRFALGHTTSMWWSQDWSQLGQMVSLFPDSPAGCEAGYPREKGQGTAEGRMKRKKGQVHFPLDHRGKDEARGCRELLRKETGTSNQEQ